MSHCYGFLKNVQKLTKGHDRLWSQGVAQTFWGGTSASFIQTCHVRNCSIPQCNHTTLIGQNSWHTRQMLHILAE